MGNMAGGELVPVLGLGGASLSSNAIAGTLTRSFRMGVFSTGRVASTSIRVATARGDVCCGLRRCFRTPGGIDFAPVQRGERGRCDAKPRSDSIHASRMARRIDSVGDPWSTWRAAGPLAAANRPIASRQLEKPPERDPPVIPERSIPRGGKARGDPPTRSRALWNDGPVLGVTRQATWPTTVHDDNQFPFRMARVHRFRDDAPKQHRVGPDMVTSLYGMLSRGAGVSG